MSSDGTARPFGSHRQMRPRATAALVAVAALSAGAAVPAAAVAPTFAADASGHRLAHPRLFQRHVPDGRAVAVTPGGTAYVLTDSEGYRSIITGIQSITPTGRLIERIGYSGSNPDQLRAPSAIAVDRADGKTTLVVADTGNRRVDRIIPSSQRQRP